MAYEVKNKWKDSTEVEHKISTLSNRESYSREINEEYGEGGGLNAGYDVVEAVANYANQKGRLDGKEYGKDFIFKTSGFDDDGNSTVIFEFKKWII